MRGHGLATVFSIVVLGLQTVVAAQTSYTILDLGQLTQGLSTFPRALNNGGESVGWGDKASGGTENWAFYSQAGTMSAIPRLSGSYEGSVAYDINGDGTVVGDCFVHITHWIHRAFVWSSQGGTQALPGLAPANESSAQGIANDGTIVGWSLAADGQEHAVTWVGGTPARLDDAGIEWSHANRINNTGWAVGFARPVGQGAEVPCIWRNGQQQLLPFAGQALGVNDSGHVVGHGSSGSFFWNGHDTVWLDQPGCVGGYAVAINNKDEIVGHDATGGAWVWRDGTKTYLDSLTPSRGTQHMYQALDINDSGQIVVDMRRDSQPWDKAALLTPVPEPATLALLALGGLALMRRRKKYRT